jgi:hypothetical protein
VELRGLEPLASCMPSGGSISTRVHSRRSLSQRVSCSVPPSAPVAVLPCCTALLAERITRAQPAAQQSSPHAKPHTSRGSARIRRGKGPDEPLALPQHDSEQDHPLRSECRGDPEHNQTDICSDERTPGTSSPRRHAHRSTGHRALTHSTGDGLVRFGADGGLALRYRKSDVAGAPYYGLMARCTAPARHQPHDWLRTRTRRYGRLGHGGQAKRRRRRSGHSARPAG